MGFAPVLEAEAQGEDAVNGCDAAAMDDLARLVEDRDPQPRVRAPVPGRPYDGLETLGPQVDYAGAGGKREPGHRLGFPRRPRAGDAGDVLVDPGEDAAQAPVGVGDLGLEVVGEDRLVTVEPAQAPGDDDTEVAQIGRGRAPRRRSRR